MPRRPWTLVIAGLLFGLLPGVARAQDTDAVPTVSITLVGDTGSSGQPVNASGVQKNGQFLRWSELLTGISSDIAGDLQFANIETVVTTRNDLQVVPKEFNFRMHPAGLRELVAHGFNVLSLANNHSLDYGIGGLLETLQHVESMRGNGVNAAAGVGRNREQAISPSLFAVKGYDIAFAAMGIGTNNLPGFRPTADRPGQVDIRSPLDFDEVVDRLQSADVKYRILSMHYGIEYNVRPQAEQVQRWRNVVQSRDIDLIVGHHPHVVAGIELIDGRLVFYGLGNFMHHGTRSLSYLGACRDFGLVARVTVRPGPNGRLAPLAVEAIPVVNTDVRPRRLAVRDSQKRIEFLNLISKGLSPGVDFGLKFQPQTDGTGVACMPGSETLKNRLGDVCRRWVPPPTPTPDVERGMRASCGRWD